MRPQIGFAQVTENDGGFTSINQSGQDYTGRPAFTSAPPGVSVTTLRMERGTVVLGVGGYLSAED